MSQLYLISTPIGNLEDITLRAIKTLFAVNILLCEDTRRTGKLLERLSAQSGQDLHIQAGEKPRLISFHEHNNLQRIPEVLEYLRRGKGVGLVSNAGTPLISDPGFKLVNKCIEEGYEVIPIPGPSALTAAMSVSGLTPARVLFLGFLSKRKGKKKKLLEQTKRAAKALGETLCVILYESPYRLEGTLDLIRAVFDDPKVALCIEMTKMHESTLRGKASDLVEKVSGKGIRGEVTIVVEL
jgi:16S rRNA (cytidine1402-2'-O)-methyltransferase